MSVPNDIKWEAAEVKKLGAEIGYGNMMALASALWRKMLREKYPDNDITGGAFVPTLMQDLKGEAKRIAQKGCKQYDELVKDI